MPAIRFTAVISKTKEYTIGQVVETFDNLKASDFPKLRENCPEGLFVICIGWTNPGDGTWITD